MQLFLLGEALVTLLSPQDRNAYSCLLIPREDIWEGLGAKTLQRTLKLALTALNSGNTGGEEKTRCHHDR